MFKRLLNCICCNCLQYSHESCLALLQVVSFGPCAWFAAKAHDEATFVDKVTGDIHSQQQEYEYYDKDPCPEHDAHGERRLITQIWQRQDKGGRALNNGSVTV